MENANTIYLSFVAEEDYDEFRRLCDDPVTRDYGQYTNNVENVLKEARSVGSRVVKVRIDPKELADWCVRVGRKVDAGARASYAALIANGKENGRHWKSP